MFYCYLSGGGEWNRLERRTRRAGNGKKKALAARVPGVVAMIAKSLADADRCD